MTRRILIVDDIPTRRIVMKAKLRAAQYEVAAAADLDEACELITAGRWDVVFVDRDLNLASGAANIFARVGSKLSAERSCVIMIADPVPEAAVIEAFRAGFDEVIQRPLSERVLLAQLRARMRRHADRDNNGDPVYLKDLPTAQTLPRLPAKLAIVAPSLAQARDCAAAMTRAAPRTQRPQTVIMDFEGSLAALGSAPDFDAVLLMAEPEREEAALNLLSDLRSRGAACGAGLIIGLAGHQPTFAARAFDLGADDVVNDLTGPAELALRADRLAQRKHSRDALRLKVMDGLRMAVTDPLTGVKNRRYATQKLAQIAESGAPFALLMLDLDHFKRINDLHGHGVGDKVLETIARTLRLNLREADLLARVGGEEFLVALPGSVPEQAVATAERLRQTIDHVRVVAPDTGATVRVTASIGLTHSSEHVGRSVDALMAGADRALYQAKLGGRNTVSVDKAAA